MLFYKFFSSFSSFPSQILLILFFPPKQQRGISQFTSSLNSSVILSTIPVSQPLSIYLLFQIFFSSLHPSNQQYHRLYKFTSSLNCSILLFLSLNSPSLFFVHQNKQYHSLYQFIFSLNASLLFFHQNQQYHSLYQFTSFTNSSILLFFSLNSSSLLHFSHKNFFYSLNLPT